MKTILSRKEMQEMDKRTIEEFGISSLTLMELAGARCADRVLAEYPTQLEKGLIVLCGSGNNGGDGYVLARHLMQKTDKLLIVSYAQGRESEECRHNRELCQRLGIEIVSIKDQNDLQELIKKCPSDFGIIIDALYGIGFRGELPPILRELFDLIEQQKATKIALDIASGIDADTGCGHSFKMDKTYAIHALKYGHLIEKGKQLSGKLEIVPISIPKTYEEGIKAFHIDESIYPPRKLDSHKGNYGRIMIIGGSPGYLGSVKLSAMAALRSGGGLVCLFTRRQNLDAYYSLTPEVMCFALPEFDEEEELFEEKLSVQLSFFDSIAIGSGMALDDYALKVLKVVLKHSEVPTIIDADAITLMAQNAKLEEYLNKDNFLLTPHLGEFSRLMKLGIGELKADIIKAAKDFGRRYRAAVLVKSDYSIFVQGEELRVVTAGNDGLATGGSGDALAGVIASFLAQGLPLKIAAPSASCLMGKTAEKLAEMRRSFSILPSDIINELGRHH